MHLYLTMDPNERLVRGPFEGESVANPNHMWLPQSRGMCTSGVFERGRFAELLAAVKTSFFLSLERLHICEITHLGGGRL